MGWIAAKISSLTLVALLLGCSAPPEARSQGEVPLRRHLPQTIAQLTQPITPIGDLTSTTVNKTVSVIGEVQHQAPLLDNWLYQVSDDTGTLWVMSPEEPPEPGTQVRVRGVLRYEAIVVGDQDLGDYYLQESSRSIQSTETSEETDP